MDGIFHGNKPVGRPRLRWKDIRSVLVAAEYKRMEETSR
jgi:hypothetical protein